MGQPRACAARATSLAKISSASRLRLRTSRGSGVLLASHPCQAVWTVGARAGFTQAFSFPHSGELVKVPGSRTTRHGAPDPGPRDPKLWQSFGSLCLLWPRTCLFVPGFPAFKRAALSFQRHRLSSPGLGFLVSVTGVLAVLRVR